MQNVWRDGLLFKVCCEAGHDRLVSIVMGMGWTFRVLSQQGKRFYATASRPALGVTLWGVKQTTYLYLVPGSVKVEYISSWSGA
jgi:hypothetical protein